MFAAMSKLRGRVAAITGAASGIGQALAWELAARGCDLAISDVNVKGLEETAARISGTKVTTALLDVADREAFQAWADDCIRDHGKVDVIVNNAGVAVADSVLDMSYDDLDWIVGINFWGVIHGTKAFLPHFVERDTGWVVNISSIFGMVAFPTQAAYNATKFAVRGWTEALRWELEDSNVTVCSVHPGGIATNIVRNARVRRDIDGSIADPELTAKRFDRIARTTPAQAAKVIADGMEKGEPRILIGADAKLMDTVQRIIPRRYGVLMNRLIEMMER